MTHITEQDLDERLNNMKTCAAVDEDYQSVDDFKAEFFRKAHAQKKSPVVYVCWYGGVAAMLLACIGLFGTFVHNDLLEKQETRLAVATNEAETPGLSHAVMKSETQPQREPELNERADKIPQVKGAQKSEVFESMVGYAMNKPMVAGVGVVRGSDAESLGAMMTFRSAAVESKFGAFGAKMSNTEEYKALNERGFIRSDLSPLSTFGADVDHASYTNVRRFLTQNVLPPKDAVRTEEFLNYFTYDYPAPQADGDFNVHFESMAAPWAPERTLLLVGVQARKVDVSQLPPSNFVFLIDNSGSMSHVFPMVIEAMETLAGRLRKHDRISIVTYGGGVQVLLDGGSGADKEQVASRIRELGAGGYTPGGAGIVEAYKLAHKHFIKGGNNRIVLITDGDFNVGASSESALVEMVEKERQSAIYLSAFGVGWGNYKDNKLKMLANKGNGNYTYLDSVREAKNVMTHEMTGKMFTLAKDVKFQLEFNPAKVAAYRLVGYELRELAARDFNDDTKDSGDVGVGHQVTAIYELIMADAPAEVKKKYMGSVDELKYQTGKTTAASSGLMTFKLRYQKPEGKEPSRLMTFELERLPEATDNIRWAAAVTEFSLLLRNSEHKGNADYQNVRNRAKGLLGDDADGKRAELLHLVKIAEDLQKP